MEHFLAICCYGGEPFIDFHDKIAIDPTDWEAQIVQDAANRANYFHGLRNVDISMCHLFNITFSDAADQFLYDSFKAAFECRCPTSRLGAHCELPSTTTTTTVSPTTTRIVATTSLQQFSQQSLALVDNGSRLPYSMILVLAVVLLAFMGILAMMVRGCLCDCFLPSRRRDPHDAPLDPEDVRKCLQKVRENQAAREMVCEPLVSHPPPLVADSYSAPYAAQLPPIPPNQTYPNAPQLPTNPNFRSSSPPPAYNDVMRNPSQFSSTPI
ncbi:unnamed protein product [Caenorhabditis bovis]|uniref:Uncharacterized protein n=1 Tax=Caenorhabditis bovis TaxID=2654633 RepID=A0A8S1FF82_9PELO|nr:unnamed protein product [Caenorhabditis bovis]